MKKLIKKYSLKKISYIFISMVFFFFKKILNKKNILSPWIQLKINPFIQTIVYENGKLIFGKNIVIEKNVQLAAVYGGKLTIGDNVYINTNCIITCRKSIEIGMGSILGPNISIFDHDHKYGSKGKMSGYKCSEIKIGKNCWIGTGVIILRGSIIGSNSIIGAGCIIHGIIPENSIVKNNQKLIIEEL